MAHKVDLSWNASADSVDGYNVYRGTVPGAEGTTPINPALVTGLVYTDNNVGVGVKYSYVVTAVKNGFESLHSNEFTSSVILPSPPTNLVGVIT